MNLEETDLEGTAFVIGGDSQHHRQSLWGTDDERSEAPDVVGISKEKTLMKRDPWGND